jgi:O-antigen ligase
VSTLLGAAWYPLTRGFALNKFHSNDFTCAAAMGVVLCFGAIVERFPLKSPTKVVMSLATFLLLLGLGTSAASIVSTVAGCVVVLVLGRSVGRVTSTAVIIGALLILISLCSWETAKTVLFPGKTNQQILSLHGRTQMWQHYFHVFRESPFVGEGFPTGEKTALRELKYYNSSHNAIVSAAVNTGSVGLFLFTGALAIIVWKGLLAVARGRALSRTAMGVCTAAALNMMAYPLLGSHWFWPTTVLLASLAFASFHIWNTPLGQPAEEPIA